MVTQKHLHHAVAVKIGGTEIKVVCEEIIKALKLIAWNENRSRQKDISDSWFIISQYSKIDPTSYEYVVDNYLELLSQCDHEVEFAEALHIGIKQKKLLKAEAHGILKNILENEDNLSRIAQIHLIHESKASNWGRPWTPPSG